MTKYIFTLDIDWAPEEIIADTLQLFEQHKVKVTLFATHKSEQILNANTDKVEVAIHPNFNELIFNNDQKKPKEVLTELLDIYPDSIGVRSHSLTQSSGLVNLFKEVGMMYESNTLLPYFSEIQPYKCWSGLTRIPYNWEDDVHFTYGNKFDGDGLSHNCKYKIYDFHPMHIFLNTDVLETYNKAKFHYHDFEILKKFINKSNLGTRDLLINLLGEISKNNIETYFMRQLII